MQPKKSDLRTRMIALREELAAREPDAGEVLAGRFPMRLLERYGPIVSGYWPIGSEIDPRPLLSRLHGAGARLCLPRVGDDGQLEFRAWAPGDTLTPAKFGLMEPGTDQIELQPSLLLLPLLAFDTSGGRLGYGKGHYDRALEALRADGRAFACGLAFDGQRVEAVPSEAHDQPLDWVVTPGGNFPLFLSRAMAS